MATPSPSTSTSRSLSLSIGLSSTGATSWISPSATSSTSIPQTPTVQSSEVNGSETPIAVSTLSKGYTSQFLETVTSTSPTTYTSDTGGVLGPSTSATATLSRRYGTPLEILFTEQNGTYTWLVDMTAGSNVTFLVTDANGLSGQSAPVVVLPNCPNGNCSVNSTDGASRLTCPSPSTSASSPPIGAIVGGVIGAIAACMLVVLGVLLLRRRRSPSHRGRPGRWSNGAVDLLDKSDTASESLVESPSNSHINRLQMLNNPDFSSTINISPIHDPFHDRNMVFSSSAGPTSLPSPSEWSTLPVMVEHSADTSQNPSDGRSSIGSVDSLDPQRAVVSPAPTYSTYGVRGPGTVSPAPTYYTLDRSSAARRSRASTHRVSGGEPSGRRPQTHH